MKWNPSQEGAFARCRCEVLSIHSAVSIRVDQLAAAIVARYADGRESSSPAAFMAVFLRRGPLLHAAEACTAVHSQRLAGDESRLVRGQKCNRCRDLVRLAKPAIWNLRQVA
jgi:hypothetical protein